tara:strand:- start:2703 stop:2981 length:279 start_codon:yes stop_codon:yes gene_type:complete
MLSKKEELEKYYKQLTESDSQSKSMMAMSNIFNLIKDVEFHKEKEDSSKLILLVVSNMNTFIKAKFQGGDEIFAKSILDDSIAGLSQHLEYL